MVFVAADASKPQHNAHGTFGAGALAGTHLPTANYTAATVFRTSGLRLTMAIPYRAVDAGSPAANARTGLPMASLQYQIWGSFALGALSKRDRSRHDDAERCNVYQAGEINGPALCCWRNIFDVLYRLMPAGGLLSLFFSHVGTRAFAALLGPARTRALNGRGGRQSGGSMLMAA